MVIQGEVPRGEKILYSGTDLESYIAEHTSAYEDNTRPLLEWVFLSESRLLLATPWT